MEAPRPSPITGEPNRRDCNPNPSSPSPSPVRLWRPAAQRNLRNQWSALRSARERWAAAAAEGRSHATALVNAHLSRKYLPEMELGALKDMPGIREKAAEKLAQKQELCLKKLLSSYKDMVVVVSHFVKAARSMRCFIKGSVSSPLMQFSECPEDKNDSGDGGGIPVFHSFPISYFENLAEELVEMFGLELILKRLLVVELLSTSSREAVGGQIDVINWSNELYIGEFRHLEMSGLLSTEDCTPFHPRIKDWRLTYTLDGQSNIRPNREIFQVYLTTWLAEVNIDMNRIEDIFSMIEEEMQIKLS